ncbi:hypothetical protein E3A20_21750, partial [Planctomyces bekefii]
MPAEGLAFPFAERAFKQLTHTASFAGQEFGGMHQKGHTDHLKILSANTSHVSREPSMSAIKQQAFLSLAAWFLQHISCTVAGMPGKT